MLVHLEFSTLNVGRSFLFHIALFGFHVFLLFIVDILIYFNGWLRHSRWLRRQNDKRRARNFLSLADLNLSMCWASVYPIWQQRCKLYDAKKKWIHSRIAIIIIHKTCFSFRFYSSVVFVLSFVCMISSLTLGLVDASFSILSFFGVYVFLHNLCKRTLCQQLKNGPIRLKWLSVHISTSFHILSSISNYFVRFSIHFFLALSLFLYHSPLLVFQFIRFLDTLDSNFLASIFENSNFVGFCCRFIHSKLYWSESEFCSARDIGIAKKGGSFFFMDENVHSPIFLRCNPIEVENFILNSMHF